MKNEKNKGVSLIEKLFTGRAFYATLAGVTLAIGVLTYFGIKASFKPGEVEPKPQVEDPDKKPGTVDIPDDKPSVTDPTDPVIEPDDPTPPIATVSFVIPLRGVVTKEYSGDALVFSNTMGDYRAHVGIDVTAEEGTEVCAVADGKITAVYTDDMKGVCVEITHEDGYVSVYRNLKPVLADRTVKGADVVANDVIGYVGNSALLEIGEPCHLHFELQKDGDWVDPVGVLPKFEK